MNGSITPIPSRITRLLRDDRDLGQYGSLGVIFAGLLAMMLLALPGCSSGQAHAVDTPRAQEALKTALEHWKRGETPRSLSASATPMTVQDLEWESGARLIDYQILGEGEPAGANLRVRVKVTTEGGKGKSKSTEKTVNYLVGTSPSVTVFRDMLRR
jgi:hypothetical protein